MVLQEVRQISPATLPLANINPMDRVWFMPLIWAAQTVSSHIAWSPITRMSFIFLKPGDDPDSFIKNKGKDAFLKLVDEAITFSEYFLNTIKKQDDLSSIEGRSRIAQFAVPLVDKIVNPTLREAYISEIGHICDLDFGKLLNGVVNIVPENIGSILLNQIPGISSTTSLILMEKFGSIYNLIKEIEMDKERKKLIDIKYKTKTGKERRISKKCIENIYTFLLYKKI